MVASRITLLNDAKLCLRNGRLAQAERFLQQALQGNPRDVEAMTLLGAVAYQVGAWDRADSIFQRCHELEPREPSHMVNLAKVRVITGRLKEAVEMFDFALKKDKRHAMAMAGKADALNQLGERTEARSLIESAAQAHPDNAEIAAIHAAVLQQDGEHEPAIRVAERHFNGASITKIVAARLGLIIGRSYETLEQYDKAFDAYAKANAVRATNSQFDPARYVSMVDRIIAYFTPERVRSLVRSTVESDRMIFIVGMPRSGTTLVEQIIAAHPGGHGAGETPALERLIGAFSRESAGGAPYPECLDSLAIEQASQLSRVYLHETGGAAPQAARVVDKYLANHHFLGLIQMLLPRSRVIYMRRDPLDTCISCYSMAISPIMNGYVCDLRHLGLYFRQYERLMAHWQRVLELPILELQYESIVGDPEPMTRAVIDFCGLPWDDACLRFHEKKRAARTVSFDQVRRPIYDTSIGRARHFEAHLGPLRESLGLAAV